jgi:hypothetical protein
MFFPTENLECSLLSTLSINGGFLTADPCLVLSVLAVEGAREVGLDDTLALSAHCRVLLPIDKYYFLFNGKQLPSFSRPPHGMCGTIVRCSAGVAILIRLQVQIWMLRFYCVINHTAIPDHASNKSLKNGNVAGVSAVHKEGYHTK